jgi:hypothetical protein
MAERGLERKDLEEIFTGFEKRQDEKLYALEGRMGGKFQALEGRMDGKLQALEGRMDSKMKGLEERVVNQFHIISEGLMDHIKLLSEGHAGIIVCLDRMEKENERQHTETRALVKLSFSELDRRLSDLESQVTVRLPHIEPRIIIPR